MKTVRFIAVALWPLDVLLGAALLLVSGNSRLAQTYCYGDWREVA
jgi:hypothetical protein